MYPFKSTAARPMISNNKTLLLTALLSQVVLSITANADVIAATNFDGRGLAEVNVADDTATGLNWMVNGVDDPGNMSVLREGGSGLRLFNANELVQNMFSPGINTGNGNTFWTTTVDLTVASGSAVTITDVTFDNWSVSAAQVQNVNRRNDFTFSIIDPSGTTVSTVDILDSVSGTGVGVPNFTATFPSPVALTAPGTYKLAIKAGDFLGANETGNHTAFDNLSINGTVSGGSSFDITAIDYDAEADTLTLTWDSRPGEKYAVRFTTDLGDWLSDLEDEIEADGEDDSTTKTFDLSNANLQDATRVFFRVEVQADL